MNTKKLPKYLPPPASPSRTGFQDTNIDGDYGTYPIEKPDPFAIQECCGNGCVHCVLDKNFDFDEKDKNRG